MDKVAEKRVSAETRVSWKVRRHDSENALDLAYAVVLAAVAKELRSRLQPEGKIKTVIRTKTRYERPAGLDEPGFFPDDYDLIITCTVDIEDD